MWVLYAVTAAFFMAVMRVANQQFKYSGIDLTFVTKLFLTLFTLPFLFFLHWPESPWFYVFTLATAPLVVYLDKCLYDYTSAYGAGPVTRIEPLSVPFVFLAWLLLNPSLLLAQLEKPLILSGIAACVVAAAFFASRLRKCEVSGRALRTMIPLIFVAGTINLLSKAGIDHLAHENGIVIYVFLQSSVVAAISYALVEKRSGVRKKVLQDTKLVQASFGLAWIIMAIMVLRLWAFKETVNPAYVTSIMLTGPFWTLLLNRVLGYKEAGQIAEGMGIVFAVFTMTILTTM